ncbi:unnamed protein product [Dicrocoelium dendriticum]|nr:unnamed protein product [Dicrocoelium dendriticum]
MKMTQNGHSPKSLKAPPVASSPFTSFLVGSYVMASWRNQFEYLAEVLAHRHRQGDKSEYRLRYVWDNVVEWTPVSRLRKATQFEIDYVLKFCREHGGEGSGKPLSEVSPKSTDKSVRSSSVSASSPMTSAPPTFSTRSQTKKLSLEPNSCLTKTAHSTNQSGTPSATASSEPKTNPLSLVSDGVQQDGMVYDKAVLQFHEACRRRRELKRQAIEEDKPSTTDSIVSTLGETPVACAPKTNSTNSPPHIPPESKEEVIQSFAPLPKAAKLSPTDDTDSSHHSSPRLPSASELENSVDPHNDIDVRESKINTCRTSANSPKAATSLAPVASPSKNTLKTRASPNVQLESTTKSSSSTQVAKRPAVEWNTLPSTPVIYQCPHCPRKLRHSKLLAAHIANYHKSAQDASKPSPSGPALTRADKQASTTAECTRSTSLTTSIKPESTNSSTSSPPPTEYPVSNPIASIPSIPTTSSGHSLLDAAATTSMYPDATMVVSNSPCLHASSEATVAGARVTAVSEHLSTNTSTCLGSTDADWLSGGIPNAKSPRLFMLPPFTSTDTSSHVPGRSLPSNSSVLEDALGSVNPFSLDMVSDTLTPDEVSVVNANLNQLDQFVLLPLERALTVMESHLDFITKQVDVLEQDQERSGTLARMSTEHSELTEDTALEPDSFLLSSSSNSPFGSSSSFSLSPYGMRPDEVPVSSELPSSTNPLDPPSSQLVCDSTSSRSHAAKQAARQLYRLTMFRRFQREAHLKSRSIRHDVPPHKGLNFSRQSPTSARLLNDRL